jgi:hypothetical protein
MPIVYWILPVTLNVLNAKEEVIENIYFASPLRFLLIGYGFLLQNRLE